MHPEMVAELLQKGKGKSSKTLSSSGYFVGR
jgi:hypothetical protein